MRCAVAMFALLSVATAAPAEDARAVRRQLIRDLLEAIDSRQFTQAMFDVFLPSPGMEEPPRAEMSEEEREEYEAIRRRQLEQMNAFRQHFFARIDYAQYDGEVYTPIVDKLFTAGELEQLIAFFGTPAGRKCALLMPELAAGAMTRNIDVMRELSGAIGEEMQREDAAKSPWSATMHDLRSVATALEAYAIDNDRYPQARSYDDLKSTLSPTYIRTLPERDAWGSAYLYSVSADGTSYRFASAGADTRFEWNTDQIEIVPERFEGRAMESLDSDIIFQDGTFIQFPKIANDP